MKITGNVASWLFRLAVAIDLVTLYSLTFSLPYTLAASAHFAAIILLTLLRIAIITFFVIDMASKGTAKRRYSKIADVFIAIGWIAILTPLVANSLRSGIW